MKLYDLHRGARLRVGTTVGLKEGTFYRIDGMYSLCVFDGDAPERDRIFHLKAWTEVQPDGGFYEIVEPS